MFDRIWVRLISQTWFWKFRANFERIKFFFESKAYKHSASVFKAKANARILGSLTWIGVKSLFWVALALCILDFVENYIRSNTPLLQPLSADNKKFNVEQLRLYAQILTAIFSIYFATIGIILSSGYNRLRRDIIQLLTSEQVGSIYSRLLVLAATFCLSATALQLLGFESGLFVYVIGTFLTLMSSLALFPLGQRLFNFFDLNLLVHSEILPGIARHIERAAKPRNSVSLAHHHSKAVRTAFEQLCYIDDRMRNEGVGLADNLPMLNNAYSALLLHYLQQKHRIDQQSYWFPRRSKHRRWFFAGDSATSMALETNSQLAVEEEPAHQWLENEIVERLVGHIKLALENGDFKLGLNLISQFSSRISTYAEQFQFDIGMQELQRMKELIEKAFASSDTVANNDEAVLRVGIADAWATLGSNLCLEMLRRLMTFEKQLKLFFKADIWTEKSLHTLPAFLQVELTFIVERIDFEREIEGQRLSKPKYVQQLAVQKLLQKYKEILSTVCQFHGSMVPSFVVSLIRKELSEAATQVILTSLHSHWKLPRWFSDLSQLIERYREYRHYPEEQYALPDINITDMAKRLASTHDDAIAMLGKGEIVKHIFKEEHNDELPDHFGQIYYQLAEACIQALEQNDEYKLSNVLPMFISLSLVASDIKFVDPVLDVDKEFRLLLVSSVLNDLASVLGYAILYGAYFDNAKLSEKALEVFKSRTKHVADKQQYLKKMILLSDSHSFSWRASPRDVIRTKWKIAFEHRARQDGFGDQMGMSREKPHKNKLVKEFLRSHSDASHLFFAIHVLPVLDPIDFKIDHHITDLARRFDEKCEESSG